MDLKKVVVNSLVIGGLNFRGQSSEDCGLWQMKAEDIDQMTRMGTKGDFYNRYPEVPLQSVGWQTQEALEMLDFCC